jgi:hypothetical protein
MENNGIENPGLVVVVFLPNNSFITNGTTITNEANKCRGLLIGWLLFQFKFQQEITSLSGNLYR